MTSAASEYKSTHVHSILLDLEYPNYVYTNSITITFQNGAVETIDGGYAIVHDEKLNDRIVMFADDGKTIVSDKVFVDGQWKDN